MVLKIGSGDTSKFMSGKNTKGFAGLVEKFVGEFPPHYNSFGSPIDALRTGAILERRFMEFLGLEYYAQVKSICTEFDCLVSSLDFAKLDAGKVVGFKELKTIFLTEYINIIIPMSELDEGKKISFLKKKFKTNYNQVQFQLLCTGLESAKLVFLSCETYVDELNWEREIKENDFREFEIPRDENVINKLRERAQFFQNIKNYIIN